MDGRWLFGLPIFLLVGGEAAWSNEAIELVRQQKAEDRVVIAQAEDGSLVLSIHSPSGIGGVVLSPKVLPWPKSLRIRLYLRGLESWKVTTPSHHLQLQVTNHPGEPSLRQWKQEGEREVALSETSPWWTKLHGSPQSTGEKGAPPAAEGYFEWILPPALLAEGPPSLTLEWIDFYR
jgi:hypothetical protein